MQTADMNRQSRTTSVLAAIAVVVASLQSVPASAEAVKPRPATASKAAQPVPPSGELNSIIRTTLRKLNRNNKVNHYEELHEHLTPQLQLSITPQKLSDAFSGFRKNGLDLSGITQLEPQFLKPPSVDDEGTLLLNGIFPMQPRIVHFNLGYRRVDGVWMLHAFQVDTPTEAEWQAAQTAKRRAQMASERGGANGTARTAESAPALDMSTDPPTALRW